MMKNHTITTAGHKAWHIGLMVVLLIITQALSAQSKYVKKYLPLADSLSTEFKIPVAVILGVAIIESGAGTSRNSKVLNNHFGIVGKNDLMKKGIRSRYKQFPDVAASYLAFCKLVKKKKFYDKLKGSTNYTLWLDAMSKAGYSEAPVEWKQNISAAIRKHKLTAFD